MPEAVVVSGAFIEVLAALLVVDLIIVILV